MIARADSICRKLNAQVARTAIKGLSSREIARIAPEHAVLEQRALAELSKLAPPASMEQQWQQLIAYRRTLAEELIILAHDAKANDVEGIHTLGVSKIRLHRALRATATRAGFKDCAQVG